MILLKCRKCGKSMKTENRYQLCQGCGHARCNFPGCERSYRIVGNVEYCSKHNASRARQKFRARHNEHYGSEMWAAE